MPSYPPPVVMRGLILLIENPVWNLRDDGIMVGVPGQVRGVVPIDDVQRMADAGYVTLEVDEHITVTEAGVEWAGRWCQARLGRPLNPARDG